MLSRPLFTWQKLRQDGIRRLSDTSTVHRGTAFEERSRALLQNHFSMSLRRVAGPSDGGVDLQGWWWVPPLEKEATSQPSNRRRLRVFAQCKAEKVKFGARYVREMEGVLYRFMGDHPVKSNNETSSPYPSVALLVSESAFTKPTLQRVFSSPLPFLCFHLPLSLSRDVDTVASFFWNPALSAGVLDGDMEIRWEHSLSGAGRPGLWWRGEKVWNWTPDSTNSPLDDGSAP